MFSRPIEHFKGIDEAAGWAGDFEAALKPIPANRTPKTVFNERLGLWSRAGDALGSDSRYGDIEKYCLRQSFLGQIFQVFSRQFPQTPMERSFAAQARRVVEITPADARPADLSFLTGNNIIRKTLQHLGAVREFYAQKTKPPVLAGAEAISGGNRPLPVTPGFRATTVMPPDMTPTQARTDWQLFISDNQYPRVITLGNDAQEVANMADPIAFKPGGTMKSGRCLWIKKQEMLRVELVQMIQGHANVSLEQVRCIFLTNAGKAKSLLKQGDIIDETAIIDNYILASRG